jgi:hypothetical protein
MWTSVDSSNIKRGSSNFSADQSLVCNMFCVGIFFVVPRNRFLIGYIVDFIG